MSIRRIAALVLMSLALATRASAQSPEYLGGGGKYPFTPVVKVGRMLYLSGQIGTDTTGNVVAGGIRAETRQALTNIRALLEKNGGSMDHVVKCTVFMADMNEWATMNEVYVTFFPRHLPARSAFGASGLAKGARTEIECLGVVK
ncbi:MAG: RidA family protein [bacterium]